MFESPTRSIWWLPTIGFFLFLAIMGPWMFGDSGRIFADPGVGRHLRTAEFILETGQVPRADPLSFTKAGAPWTDYEWAFETTLGELYRAGGLPLICAFCFAIFGATVLGIYRTVLQSGVGLLPLMLVTLMAGSSLVIHFSARPVLFTYLFFALVVEVWNRRTAPLLRDWICLPIVFIAWANLHAGWIGALGFLALAITGRVADRLTGQSDGHEAPVIPWVGLTVLCAAVVSINPWGWGLYRSTIQQITGLKSASTWEEFAPPNFGTPSLADIRMAAIAVLFLIAVAFFARTRPNAPRWRWEMVLPVLFFLWEGLKAQRHVLLMVEIAAVPIARDLNALLGRALPPVDEILDRFQARQREAGGDAWLALLTAVVAAVVFARMPPAEPIQVGRNVSPQFVTFLRDHPDRFQRPFTTTANAGPLLWAMRPGFRVSIDDRGDFYGDAYVYRFADTLTGAPGWADRLKQDNYDSLLLDPNWQLNELLKSRPEWKEVWRDKNVVVYWRTTNQP
jgi:hypothetical protein